MSFKPFLMLQLICENGCFSFILLRGSSHRLKKNTEEAKHCQPKKALFLSLSLSLIRSPSFSPACVCCCFQLFLYVCTRTSLFAKLFFFPSLYSSLSCNNVELGIKIKGGGMFVGWSHSQRFFVGELLCHERRTVDAVLG